MKMYCVEILEGKLIVQVPSHLAGLDGQAGSQPPGRVVLLLTLISG